MKGTGPFGHPDPILYKPVAVLRLPGAPGSSRYLTAVCFLVYNFRQVPLGVFYIGNLFSPTLPGQFYMFCFGHRPIHMEMKVSRLLSVYVFWLMFWKFSCRMFWV